MPLNMTLASYSSLEGVCSGGHGARLACTTPRHPAARCLQSIPPAAAIGSHSIASAAPAVRSRGIPLPAAAASRSATAQQAALEDLPPPPPPLRPPAIIHTTAHLQQTQQLVVPQLPTQDDEEQQQRSISDLDSNALVWALRKVDDQLNMVEQQPSDIHKAVYDFSNGPVGQATSKGVQVAAKLTMTATIEAAKVAAPVGKWALQQGFKAAVGLVGAAIQQENKQKKQQKTQQQTQKQKQQGSGRESPTRRR